MKILEIASFFPPQGGAFVLDQARALQAAGHEVHILHCNQIGITNGLFQWLRPSQHPSMRAIPKCTHLNQCRWVKQILAQYAAYKREHGVPDVIHAQCGIWAGVAAMTISQLEESAHVPYYITEHIPVELFEREFGTGWSRHPWAGKLMREVYQQAQCVIHVAPEQFDWLAPFYGRDYRHTFISNIIDTDFFGVREPEQVPHASRIACLALADIHRKGYDVLAEAMNQLPECKLSVAGRGTDNSEMQLLFQNRSNVCLLGELDREAVRSLLCESDVLVLPSRSEVQPLALLEAMCMGLPVVTTDAITRVVQISDACWVARAGDANSLAEQIRKALSQGALSAPVVEEIRQQVSPQTLAQKLISLFNQTR